MLTVARTPAFFSSTAEATMMRMRSATTSAASTVVSGSTMPNSSPP